MLGESAPAQLVADIRAGDTDAETRLVRRFDAPLMELLTARSGDRNLAEDLRQETLRIVIERLRGRGIDDPERLPAFVCQTARNLLIAHRRKDARRRTTSDTTVVELQRDEHAAPARDYDRERTAAVVAELLAELRQERDREILRRFYVLDQPKADVCDTLDLSPQHFDRVLHRARRRFRELLLRRGFGTMGELP